MNEPQTNDNITVALLNELSNAGFYYTDIHNIYKQKSLEPEVVTIILNWLPAVYKEHLGRGDQLARSLISAREPFNPQLLIEFFEKNIYNKSVMWGVAHVIAVANTFDISDWIKHQLLREYYTFERSGLLSALTEKCQISTLDELITVLKKIFLKYSSHESMFKLFKKYGRNSDIPFLEEQKDQVDKKLSYEIEKLITGIRSKKREPKFP